MELGLAVWTLSLIAPIFTLSQTTGSIARSKSDAKEEEAIAKVLGEFAVATVLNMPEGSRTATIESKTNFIRPAPIGTKVIGESTALHKGKRTMTWQTKVMTEEGKLIAFVTQTQMVIDQQ